MSAVDIATENEVIALALRVLRTAGWHCVPPCEAPGDMLEPGVVAKMCGLTSSSLHRRIHSYRCPKFHAEYGAAGKRIVRMKLTPELETYLKRPLLKRQTN